MFSIIYCFLPIFLVIFNMYLLKSRDYVSWDVKKGKMCYNCKTDLNLSEEEIFKRLGNYSDEHMSLCLSCSRDIKLNSIISPIRSNFYIIHRNFSEACVYHILGTVRTVPY